jgi:hypothetical protein
VTSALLIVLSWSRAQHATVTYENTFSRPPPRLARHRPGLAGLRWRREWELHPGVRSASRLSLGKRAANRARDGLSSWIVVAWTCALMAVGIAAALRPDDRTGPVTVLGLVLSCVAVVELPLVLMATRPADQTAAELALHDLDSTRPAAAAIKDLRDEVQRLRGDLTGRAARLQTSSKQS